MPEIERKSEAANMSSPIQYEGDRQTNPLSSSAVLFIDFQHDFCHVDGVAGRLNCDLAGVRRAVKNAARLLAGCREFGVPVIHSRHIEEKHGLSGSASWTSFTRRGNGPVTIRGSWGARHLIELEPSETELTVEKYRSSAFHGTNLVNLLRARKIEHIAVCGVLAEGCVDATVRDGLHNDFFVSVVTDATASHSQEIFEAYLKIVRARYESWTAEELLERCRHSIQRPLAAAMSG